MSHSMYEMHFLLREGEKEKAIVGRVYYNSYNSHTTLSVLSQLWAQVMNAIARLNKC